MAIRIFNTLTRSKETFQPLTPGKVKMYVCGPTVYDAPHLGHARSAVVFDVIRRYLTALGHQVSLVRNITDIDDKIVNKARECGRDAGNLSSYYARRHQEAMARLNVLFPDAEPRVTEFIPLIQDFILKLIQKGNAYRAGGDVFFAVKSAKNYGRLSGRGFNPGSDAGVTAGKSGKKHPADFVLWKSAKPQEPFWPSPWGPGRPGWHIECSAMSTHYLGEMFDVHGGGLDLIFPHHENEIAQSESLFQKTPASYWIHNGLVQGDDGRKMSKTLGNFVNLQDLLEIYSPDAVRLFLLSKRYRRPMEFSHDRLEAAAKNIGRINAFFASPDLPGPVDAIKPQLRSRIWSGFREAMEDDFNFPRALAVVFQSIRALNPMRNMAGGRRPGITPDSIFDLWFICRCILGFNLPPQRS